MSTAWRGCTACRRSSAVAAVAVNRGVDGRRGLVGVGWPRGLGRNGRGGVTGVRWTGDAVVHVVSSLRAPTATAAVRVDGAVAAMRWVLRLSAVAVGG